ncbi:unnamed protein product [Gulo gulo]|uniref:Uncharacterized protein n=1 Tax=Gulo gulo TaxID=48420 RepID=A0A9X9PXV6_GULGU|nr:unnamed protein product [Gulo gulo]
MGAEAGPEARGGGRRGPVAVLPSVFRAGTCAPRFRDDRSSRPQRNLALGRCGRAAVPRLLLSCPRADVPGTVR